MPKLNLGILGHDKLPKFKHNIANDDSSFLPTSSPSLIDPSKSSFINETLSEYKSKSINLKSIDN